MSMSFAQMRDRARLLYKTKQTQIEQARAARDARDKRPEQWFSEQEGALGEIAEIGTELSFIADHAEAYAEWKAGLRNDR